MDSTELGKIKIHKNVIASITGLAACQIDGVKTIGKDLQARVREFLDRKEHTAVKVEIDKNGEVWVEIPLVIKFGYNIPDVAGKVQENVRHALEKMTSLTIKDININVQGIEKP
ncbi:MAG: Asp23/Gls24 family envelope stress response protein [Deltaproteobacteria bacterium]